MTDLEQQIGITGPRTIRLSDRPALKCDEFKHGPAVGNGNAPAACRGQPWPLCQIAGRLLLITWVDFHHLPLRRRTAGAKTSAKDSPSDWTEGGSQFGFDFRSGKMHQRGDSIAAVSAQLQRRHCGRFQQTPSWKESSKTG